MAAITVNRNCPESTAIACCGKVEIKGFFPQVHPACNRVNTLATHRREDASDLLSNFLTKISN